MSAKTWQGEGQLPSLLREENESRPITPPCRNVVGRQMSNGLLVLSPENGNVKFNSEVTITTNRRHGSADRIERKLRTVERSSSAGGRFVDESRVDLGGVLEEGKKAKPTEKELKGLQAPLEKTDGKSESNSQKISNENSERHLNDITNSLDNLDVNDDLPMELKAEFLSCVMTKDYEKALSLCNEMLVIDPENKTCAEFQILIKEKLRQETSSDEDSENDESGTDDDDNDDDSDESDDSDDDDDEESTENEESSNDEDEEEESESSSDSDIELPSGPINLLMGGLPVRPCSAPADFKSGILHT